MLSTLQHLSSDLRGCGLPDIGVIHLGLCDLGLMPGVHLILCMGSDLKHIRDLCSRIVFSDLAVPLNSCNNMKAINKSVGRTLVGKLEDLWLFRKHVLNGIETLQALKPHSEMGAYLLDRGSFVQT